MKMKKVDGYKKRKTRRYMIDRVTFWKNGCRLVGLAHFVGLAVNCWLVVLTTVQQKMKGQTGATDGQQSG